MRLKNMYFTCKTYQDYINAFKLSEVKSGSNTMHYEIPNYNEFLRITNDLNSIECLKTTLKSINGLTGIALTGGDKNIVETSKLNKFNIAFDIIRSKVNTIVELGNSVGFSEIEFGFDVKIPPNLTLGEMSNCLADMDKIFVQCPILNIDGEHIEFSNVDVGSTWLEFLTVTTGTCLILNNLAQLVDKCVIIASHIKSMKMQSEVAKTLALENNILDNIINGHKVIQTALIDKCSNELSSEHDITDPETKERLAYSIKLLSEWQSRGLEIYSSIETPKEIQVLFPSVEQQQSLKEPVVNLLGSGENSKD